MRFALPLLFSFATAQLPPSLGSRGLNPAGCPQITCVMFCKDGLQKDDKGCDKCSCVRDGGKLATGTSSCKRDTNGCCSELGMAWCSDQNFCLSTLPGAVIPCKSWGNNPPMTSASASAKVTVAGATAPQGLAPSFAASQPPPLPKISPPLGSPLAAAVSAGAAVVLSARSRCSEVMCSLYCANGFQKDARGCDLCACAGSVNGKCVPPDCGSSICPGGFSKDQEGCPTCICPAGTVTVSKGASSSVSIGGSVVPKAPSRCSEVMCAMFCENGYQKDAHGCDTCACAGTVKGKCVPADCGSSVCPGGFSKDKEGCPACICLAGAVTQAASSPVSIGGSVVPKAPSRCSEVMCAMFCENGYQKDAHGCDTCACAGSVKGKCVPADCGSSICPGGFSKDHEGCPTCICLAGSVTVPQKPSSSSRDGADALVAVDRPNVSLSPCKPSPCRSSQKCIPLPKKHCIKAPCPQYTCVPAGKKGRGHGSP